MVVNRWRTDHKPGASGRNRSRWMSRCFHRQSICLPLGCLLLIGGRFPRNLSVNDCGMGYDGNVLCRLIIYRFILFYRAYVLSSLLLLVCCAVLKTLTVETQINPKMGFFRIESTQEQYEYIRVNEERRGVKKHCFYCLYIIYLLLIINTIVYY